MAEGSAIPGGGAGSYSPNPKSPLHEKQNPYMECPNFSEMNTQGLESWRQKGSEGFVTSIHSPKMLCGLSSDNGFGENYVDADLVEGSGEFSKLV
jgi:hypothetical protein